METIAQILGFIAFGIAFAVYQMKNRKSLLITQTALVFVMGIHYLLLKAYPGMAMNLFGVPRNIVYYRKDIFKSKYIPVLFSLVVMLIGIFTASGEWSILVILGLTINTYCLSFESPQHYRISILISSPLVLAYNIAVFSMGGILLESISIISAVIGIINNRKNKNI